MDETCSESEIHLAILKFEIRKIIPSWIFWINITRYLFTTRSLLFLLLNIVDIQYKKKKEREFQKIISQKYFRHSKFTISSEKKFYSHSCESKYHIVFTLIRIMAQTSVLLSAELNLFEAWSIDIYIRADKGPVI